ncbi:hypothetical protein BDV19DRAFT_363773 [Aspergillus venezuelensis]
MIKQGAYPRIISPCNPKLIAYYSIFQQGQLSMPRRIEARPVRVANCSEYHGDPAYEMYRQATLGDVDFSVDA